MELDLYIEKQFGWCLCYTYKISNLVTLYYSLFRDLSILNIIGPYLNLIQVSNCFYRNKSVLSKKMYSRLGNLSLLLLTFFTVCEKGLKMFCLDAIIKVEVKNKMLLFIPEKILEHGIPLFVLEIL
jgi:hypothetical protein